MANKTITIIDDDSTYTDLIEMWLVDSDFKCFVSNSSTAIFDTLENSKPDLILLDLSMPSLNGHEVCAILKSREEFKNIPIVFLSAASDKEAKEKALALGARGYLSKLIQKNEFLISLQKYL